MTESAEYTGDTACSEECQVCLGDHDEAIHAATVNVHSWFRGEVTKYFDCLEPGEQYVA
jgi:hypothetical protein